MFSLHLATEVRNIFKRCSINFSACVRFHGFLDDALLSVGGTFFGLSFSLWILNRVLNW